MEVVKKKCTESMSGCFPYEKKKYCEEKNISPPLFVSFGWLVSSFCSLAGSVCCGLLATLRDPA